MIGRSEIPESCFMSNRYEQIIERLIEHIQQTLNYCNGMLSFRDHPLDRFGDIIDVSVYLSCEDSDTVVPYDENGLLLAEYFRAHGGDITVRLVPGRDHHPHFTESENSETVEWALIRYRRKMGK